MVTLQSTYAMWLDWTFLGRVGMFLGRSSLSAAIVGTLSSVGTAATIDLLPPNNEHPATIVIEGNLELGDERSFVEHALGLQDAFVVFNSDGGNLFSGLRIGEAIHQWGFSTAVLQGGTCASACALAWLGGQRRFMAPTARVGFHAAYEIENGSPRERGAPNARIGAYLGALGLST